MFRSVACLLTLLACTAGTVRAQGGGSDEVKAKRMAARRLAELQASFRNLERAGSANLVKRMELMTEVSRIGGDAAIQFMASVASNPRHVGLQGELLQLLTRVGSDSGIAAAVFRRHMGKQDPYRRMARDFLLRYAVKRRDDAWLLRLFTRDPTQARLEDRFLALRAMGRIGSKSTLSSAWTMLQDKTWQPRPGPAIGCGTIAQSVSSFEGAEAARLLLLLRRDARFLPSDAGAIRAATRLWVSRDLRYYIKISTLVDPETAKRVEAALFMGAAGIESARAPLLFLARNRHEVVAVRAAATEALGGLTLSRADLAKQLVRLAADIEPRVRDAAVAGLAHLRIAPAARALVGFIGTRLEGPARVALAQAYGKGRGQDWSAWLAQCGLPKGT